MELEGFPKMSQNWTSRIKVMLPNKLNIELRYEEELKAIGIPVHKGDIIKIHHADSKVESVTLNTGEQVEVETLLWTPPEKQSPLIEKLVQNIGLELNESGYIKTDETQETNVRGVFAAGDVQGWTGALESANAGSVAGSNIIHRWYD